MKTNRYPLALAAPAALCIAVLVLTACSGSGGSAASGAAPISAASGQWPQFRGPDGQGVSGETGLPAEFSTDEGVVWKKELPGAGASSPIIVGSRIYLTYYTGYNVPGGGRGSMDDLVRHVVAIDPQGGDIVWDREVESKLPEQERIRDDHGYTTSTPVCDGQRLYVFFGKSGVFAFDLEGNQLWQADVGSELSGWGSAASPVLYDDLVIINASVESNSLRALNKDTGDEVWRAGGIRESWNTPILVKTGNGDIELVVAIFGKVLGFNPKTGAQLWSADTDISWYMVPSIVAHDGIVYCIGGRGGGGALAVRAGGRGDVTETHRLWTQRKGSNVSSPIYHDGHLYWMNDVGGLAYCAEADTGKIVYEERIDRVEQVYASPILADGKLYYVARDGRTVVLAAKPKFEQIATSNLRDGSLFNAGFSVGDGRLYLRNDKYLYCFGRE
jgi:hypothetical protein